MTLLLRKHRHSRRVASDCSDLLEEATSLSPGIPPLVSGEPPEPGSSAQYSGNPYLIARCLAKSHASAMELHRMVRQSQFITFVSSTKRIPKQTLHGNQFRFVLLKAKDFFGNTK
jgi:predicted transcriptional regulator of viral defense system